MCRLLPRSTLDRSSAAPDVYKRQIIKGTEVTVGRADLFDDVPQELARPTVDGTTVWVLSLIHISEPTRPY